MFSPGEKSTISLDEQQDTIQINVPTNIPQGGGTLPHSSSEVHFEETNSNIPISEELQAINTYSVSRDRSQRTSKKPARCNVNDESQLIAYALAVAQEIPEVLNLLLISE